MELYQTFNLINYSPAGAPGSAKFHISYNICSINIVMDEQRLREALERVSNSQKVHLQSVQSISSTAKYTHVKHSMFPGIVRRSIH